MRREAGQPCFILDDQLPGVRGIEHILGIFLRQLRELALDRLDPGPLLRRQIGARLPELRHGLVAEPTVDAGQLPARRGLGHEAQPPPEFGVQRDLGIKRRDLRQHRIVRLAQGGRVGDRLEMRDLAPRRGQFLRRPLQGKKGARVGQPGRILRRDRVNRRLGAAQRHLDVRADVFR